MDFFMTFLAYIHTFLHPIFIWTWNLFWEITKHSGPLFQWQTLIGSFLGAFLPISAWIISYYWRKKDEKKDKRKGAIQFVEISVTQCINHSILSIIQIEDFLERIQTKIHEITEISDDVSYFPGSTNFPPMADIGLNQITLEPSIGSYYIHNKIISIDHMIRFTNAAIRKFDVDYSNLLTRNETNISRLKPKQQRYQYIQDLTWYSSMVKKVIDDLKYNGLKLFVETKIYNLKLMKNFKKTKKEYESKDMNIQKMDDIDKKIEIEVNEMLSGMKLIK